MWIIGSLTQKWIHNDAPEGRLSNSSPGSADWRRRAFFTLDFVTVCHRPFLGRNSMFWPSREKIPASAVEGCRCSDSYESLREEQVGWHTSLVRGNGSFSKKHTDSYAYILRRKIFANCEKRGRRGNEQGKKREHGARLCKTVLRGAYRPSTMLCERSPCLDRGPWLTFPFRRSDAPWARKRLRAEIVPTEALKIFLGERNMYVPIPRCLNNLIPIPRWNISIAR